MFQKNSTAIDHFQKIIGLGELTIHQVTSLLNIEYISTSDLPFTG